jgi:hypothetical protein
MRVSDVQIGRDQAEGLLERLLTIEELRDCVNQKRQIDQKIIERSLYKVRGTEEVLK